MSVMVTARPRGSVANATGAEQVGRAALGQRPGRLLGRGHVLVADVQVQRAGVALVVGLRPHAAELAAQPGGELLALLADLARRSPRGAGRARASQPGPSRIDRVDRHDRLVRVLAQRLVHLADAQRAERADDDLLVSGSYGHRARRREVTIGLSAGRPIHASTGTATARRRAATPAARRRSAPPRPAPRATTSPSRTRPRTSRTSRACLCSWYQVRGSLAAMASCRRYVCSRHHHQASCASASRATPTAAHTHREHEPLRGPDQVIQHVMPGARYRQAAPCGCPPRSSGGRG